MWTDSPPVAAGGLVYIRSADDTLYAFDAANGREVWLFRGAHSVPATVAGVLYVAAVDNSLYGLDARSGRVVWRVPTRFGFGPSGGGTTASATPVLAGGLVYVGLGDGLVHALAVGSGREVWRARAGDGVTSARAAAGVLYVGWTNEDTNTLFALNARTGKELWHRRYHFRDPSNVSS